MEFKATFILYFALFVVGVCKCDAEETKDSVSKYKLKINDGEKEVDETVEIDTEKETETIDVPDNGDTSESAPGEVKSIYDFKRSLTMRLMTNQKACFLSNSTENLPKPADLKKVLDEEESESPSQKTLQYTTIGTLANRSILSDEMKEMCKDFPIYLIGEMGTSVKVEAEEKRVRRSLFYCRYLRCYWIRYRYCYSWWYCRYIRVYRCYYYTRLCWG